MSGDRIIRMGHQHVAGVMFVPAVPVAASAHRVLDTKRSDISLVSTDDLTRTAHIRRALVELITQARQKVLFCSFLFADEEIVRALCDAAERLHGGVYVLTALGKHLRAEVLELDSDIDSATVKLQERARRHEDHLQRLAHAGVWLRSAEDCHAKFCVVDDRSVIVTSANATQEAYESNPEGGLVLRHPETALELGRLFAHVWQHLATLESTPGARLDLHSLRVPRMPKWRPLRGSASVRPVATLRKNESSLLQAAIDAIDCAQDHLSIATYSFIGMETHPIGAALSRALERNVRLDLLLQPRNHIAAQRASCAWLLRLAPDRVSIHGHRRTHTKSIVADGMTALLWTGNLEAAHGWNDGIEVGVAIEDPGVASAIAAWTSDVVRRRTHVPLVDPSVRDLVGAGQPQALSGDWTLQLPRGVSAELVSTALDRNAVELLELPAGLALRCADELLLEVRIDEANRRLEVQRARRIEGLVGSRSRGWLSESTLSVAVAPEPARSQARPSQPPFQRHRGHKKGRRRR